VSPKTFVTRQQQHDARNFSGQPASINCPADCTGSYRKSSLVTLSAIPDPDSQFLET
jgi:hypothetical protein